ncbi:unnamed protein product [Amoebophrya sp. A25]|nr:unnamed protein product [Amoebophrya sp. A25]|eukprot:GSA25T00024264001.1
MNVEEAADLYGSQSSTSTDVDSHERVAGGGVDVVTSFAEEQKGKLNAVDADAESTAETSAGLRKEVAEDGHNSDVVRGVDANDVEDKLQYHFNFYNNSQSLYNFYNYNNTNQWPSASTSGPVVSSFFEPVSVIAQPSWPSENEGAYDVILFEAGEFEISSNYQNEHYTPKRTEATRAERTRVLFQAYESYETVLGAMRQDMKNPLLDQLGAKPLHNHADKDEWKAFVRSDSLDSWLELVPSSGEAITERFGRFRITKTIINEEQYDLPFAGEQEVVAAQKAWWPHLWSTKTREVIEAEYADIRRQNEALIMRRQSAWSLQLVRFVDYGAPEDQAQPLFPLAFIVGVQKPKGPSTRNNKYLWFYPRALIYLTEPPKDFIFTHFFHASAAPAYSALTSTSQLPTSGEKERKMKEGVLQLMTAVMNDFRWPTLAEGDESNNNNNNNDVRREGLAFFLRDLAAEMMKTFKTPGYEYSVKLFAVPELIESSEQLRGAEVARSTHYQLFLGKAFESYKKMLENTDHPWYHVATPLADSDHASMKKFVERDFYRDDDEEQHSWVDKDPTYSRLDESRGRFHITRGNFIGGTSKLPFNDEELPGRHAHPAWWSHLWSHTTRRTIEDVFERAQESASKKTIGTFSWKLQLVRFLDRSTSANPFAFPLAFILGARHVGSGDSRNGRFYCRALIYLTAPSRQDAVSEHGLDGISEDKSTPGNKNMIAVLPTGMADFSDANTITKGYHYDMAFFGYPDSFGAGDAPTSRDQPAAYSQVLLTAYDSYDNMLKSIDIQESQVAGLLLDDDRTALETFMRSADGFGKWVQISGDQNWPAILEDSVRFRMIRSEVTSESKSLSDKEGEHLPIPLDEWWAHLWRMPGDAKDEFETVFKTAKEFADRAESSTNVLNWKVYLIRVLDYSGPRFNTAFPFAFMLVAINRHATSDDQSGVFHCIAIIRLERTKMPEV